MKREKGTLSLYTFFEIIPDEAAAIAYPEDCRWHGKPTCPHCDSLSGRMEKDAKPMPYRIHCFFERSEDSGAHDKKPRGLGTRLGDIEWRKDNV